MRSIVIALLIGLRSSFRSQAELQIEIVALHQQPAGLVKLTAVGDNRSMGSRYRRRRFPPEVMSHAVWLFHRFTLSFRDVEDLLAERGITVSHEAIRSWCRKFGPAYARTLRR